MKAGSSRLRYAGDFPTESHKRHGSLGKMSAGIGNPDSGNRDLGPEQPLRPGNAGHMVPLQLEPTAASLPQ